MKLFASPKFLSTLEVQPDIWLPEDWIGFADSKGTTWFLNIESGKLHKIDPIDFRRPLEVRWKDQVE